MRVEWLYLPSAMLGTLSSACKYNGYHTDRGSLKIAQPHPTLSVLCLDTRAWFPGQPDSLLTDQHRGGRAAGVKTRTSAAMSNTLIPTPTYRLPVRP